MVCTLSKARIFYGYMFLLPINNIYCSFYFMIAAASDAGRRLHASLLAHSLPAKPKTPFSPCPRYLLTHSAEAGDGAAWPWKGVGASRG